MPIPPARLLICCALLLTAACTPHRPPTTAPATRPTLGDVVTLADPPLTFRRISPARYGFPDDPDYFLLETEVTNQTFAQYLAATGAAKADQEVTGYLDKKDAESRTGPMSFTTADPSYNADHRDLVWTANTPPAGKDQFPVALVNAKQASAFCAWLNQRHPDLGTFRLPTQTEWLIAAYGRDRKYPWGDQTDDARYRRSPYADDKARWDAKSQSYEDYFEARRAAGLPAHEHPFPPTPGEFPEPVTARPAGRTPEGLYAMWGNVSEIVLPDEWKEGRFVIGLGGKWLGGGFDDLSNSPHQDYWGYTHNPDVRHESIGFRVLLDPTPGGHGNKKPAPPDDLERSIYGHPDEWPRPSRWPPAK